MRGVDSLEDTMAGACSIRVQGVVQGVGFRPFVYRPTCANTLNGWVLNAEEGVEIHLEGAEAGLQAFVRDLKAQPPPAASIAEIDVQPAVAKRRSVRPPSAIARVRCHVRCLRFARKGMMPLSRKTCRLTPRHNHGRPIRKQDDGAVVLALPASSGWHQRVRGLAASRLRLAPVS